MSEVDGSVHPLYPHSARWLLKIYRRGCECRSLLQQVEGHQKSADDAFWCYLEPKQKAFKFTSAQLRVQHEQGETTQSLMNAEFCNMPDKSGKGPKGTGLLKKFE